MDKYLLLDTDRGQFWKINNHGYTSDIKEARKFNLEDAEAKAYAPNVNDLVILKIVERG